MKSFFLFFFLAVACTGLAQNKKFLKGHYLGFEVAIADTLLNKLDAGEPESRADREKLKGNQNHLYQTVRSMILDSMLVKLNEQGIQLMNNDTLSHYLKLGAEGFPLLALSPKGPIKKLAKGGYQADLYLTFEAKLDLPGFSISSKGIQPVLEIRLNVWDANGKSVQKILYKEKSPKALLGKIDRDNQFIKYQDTEKADLFSGKYVKFDKTKRAFIDLLLSELSPLINAGVQNAAAKWGSR